MDKLNQFQFKSLSNLCFDLAKAWFISGVIGSISVSDIVSSLRLALFVVGTISCWIFVQIGLKLSQSIHNE